MPKHVRIWDLPTRLFHWLLVLLFLISWWSAENRLMDWHYRSGLTMTGLILFRVFWGFVGGSTARFASFIRSPRTVAAYLRSGPVHGIGHNPLGGYSVIAMLCALAFQIVTGLFATDIDGLDSGPLSYLLSFDQSRLAARAHALSFNVLLALVGLHVGAIAIYLVRKRNLIGPMLTGRGKQEESEGPALVLAGWIPLLLSIVIATGLAWWLGEGLRLNIL